MLPPNRTCIGHCLTVWPIMEEILHDKVSHKTSDIFVEGPVATGVIVFSRQFPG